MRKAEVWGNLCDPDKDGSPSWTGAVLTAPETWKGLAFGAHVEVTLCPDMAGQRSGAGGLALGLLFSSLQQPSFIL